MSFFGKNDGGKLDPVTRYDQQDLFGKLEKEDTAWVLGGGFVTETQTFYSTTPSGGIIMVQVIHSSVGLWYPSIQFTFRFFDPSKKIDIWRSTAVTNFVTPPSSSLDKRSSKSDQFTITVDPTNDKKIMVQGKHEDEIQISLTFTQLAEGFKIGSGPQGGMTYFGSKSSKPFSGTGPDTKAGNDGYVVHRFWPRCSVEGIIRVGKELHDLAGSQAIYISAIQGMRPNLLAAKWNFANFQTTSESGEGVSLILMELTTTPTHGSKVVNVGAVVVGDKLVAVTAGGDGLPAGVGSTVTHLGPTKDTETGYDAPSGIKYLWKGASLADKTQTVNAELTVDLLTSKAGEPYATRGLVEKVDVLGQVPYLVKKFVNYAAGTKPYIYTWLNSTKATIELPGAEKREHTGVLFNEATFIS